MNANDRTAMFKDWIIESGLPDLWITINPRVPHADLIQMHEFFNRVHGGLLRKVHGSQYRDKGQIRTVLVPEKDSKRTIGGTPQLLHYHGFIWTPNLKLLSLIQDKSQGFKTRLQRTIERNLPRWKRREVHVQTETFRKDGGCIDYALKTINRSEFNEGDIYIYR